MHIFLEWCSLTSSSFAFEITVFGLGSVGDAEFKASEECVAWFVMLSICAACTHPQYVAPAPLAGARPETGNPHPDGNCDPLNNHLI